MQIYFCQNVPLISSDKFKSFKIQLVLQLYSVKETKSDPTDQNAPPLQGFRKAMSDFTDFNGIAESEQVRPSIAVVLRVFFLNII